jgi:CheY-like chemotaxis protein
MNAILVVDDDTVFLDVVRESLASHAPQLRVYTATTVADTLAMLQGVTKGMPRPACVVLDYHLDCCDAPDLVTQLRAIDGLADLPVLVLSQFAWPQDRLAAAAVGVTRFEVKPSRARELASVVLNFWKEHAP